MKVAVVAPRLYSGGGYVVGSNICQSLQRICSSGTELLLFIPDGVDYKINDDALCRIVRCPRSSLVTYWMWERTTLQRELEEFDPDWVWSLGNYPVAGRWEQSLLVHDPHLLTSLDPRQIKGLVRRARKWVRFRVLLRRRELPRSYYCQTEVIKDKLVKKLSLDVGRVGICPPGIETRQCTEPDDSYLPRNLQQLIATKKFIFFYPSRFYPHKNHDAIVETFSRYRSDLKNVACVFTLGAGEGAGAQVLLEKIQRYSLDDSIVNIGPVEREMVFRIFSKCDGLLMPTLLETFGIPFIEAMQFRVPIVTSDYDFTRVVCGDAAIYIRDASNSSQMRDAILRLVSDSGLRQKLVDEGSEIVRTLPTWDDAVRGVLTREGVVDS